MKTTIFLALIYFCVTVNTVCAQVHVNMNWELQMGNPIASEWTHSITNSSSQIIQIGNTMEQNEGANILITNHASNGTLLWQATFNTSDSNNDYGVKVFQDTTGDVYAVGITDNYTLANYDIVVLKYSSTGTLIWSNTYGSSDGLNDIATDILLDNAGNVYVSASSLGDTTNQDYLLLKYSNAGSLLWTNRYDYNSLYDIPTGLEFDSLGNILMIGASSESISDWDYTIAKFAANGTFISDIRNSSAGSSFDTPSSFIKDASGNLFVTGNSTNDNINYDIKTVKFNSAFEIEWEQIVDYGGLEDQGKSIDIDGYGNIYVGGFVTDEYKRSQYLIKYAPNGDVIWNDVKEAPLPFTNLEATSIDVVSSGDMYLISKQMNQMNIIPEKVFVTKLDSSGIVRWQKEIQNEFGAAPSSIHVAKDSSIYATTVLNENVYSTIRFTELEMDTNVVRNANNQPIFKQNELIVRFKHDAIDTIAIDNIGEPTRKIEFERLEYFLTDEAMELFDDVIYRLCDGREDETNTCGIMAIKVFKELQTSMTSAQNKQGITIPIPDFWTTLLLKLPEGMDIYDVYYTLKDLTEVVAYSEPNFIASTTSVPNDPDYDLQHSLFSYDYDDAHINIEEAWDIYPEGGKSYIRCGVFDTGLDYQHPDFGYTSNDPNSGKVIDGWDFNSNIPLKTSNTYEQLSSHGTKCAGIIGAIRNNSVGIAGIAGGDFSQGTSNNNMGVSLYGLKILQDNQPGFFTQYSTLDYVYDALHSSVLADFPETHSYELDILSNSWRLNQFSPYWADTNIVLLREVTHFTNRMSTIFVAAAGNEGSQGNGTSYPAEIDDDWIISVGATGNYGQYNNAAGTFESNRNWLVDVAAPGIESLIRSTVLGQSYGDFEGTSAATPHVSGVAGLILSYLNSPTFNYQNLAHEDVERIIELSATDTDLPGRDSLTGYGRLNAGAAMRLIELPMNKITHFGTNTNSNSTFNRSFTALDSNVTILLRESYQRPTDQAWFARGTYKVNVFRVDSEFEHTLPTDHYVVEYWARPSGSSVFEGLDGDSLRPRERVVINSCDNTTCSASGYLYEVFDVNNTPLGWWPHSPTVADSSTIEYTILSRNIYASVDEIHEDDVELKLYPNPANQQHTLNVTTGVGEELEIVLYDLRGRKLKTIFSGKTSSQEMKIDVPLGELSPSMYIYEVRVGKLRKQLRFVKQ